MTTLSQLTVLTLYLHIHAGPLCHGDPINVVLVNEPYTFPCNASVCERADWVKIFPSDMTVATYQNQICRIQNEFHDDFICEGNCLHLKEAKFTDKGEYMFICDGKENPLTLDVLYSLKMNAVQNDNITLESYYAQDTEDVSWQHNNNIVLHYKRDGSMTIRERYRGRVSLEENCFHTGRFSLTITAVQQSDSGLYRCFNNNETDKGNPHAYELHVKEKCSCAETNLSRNLIILLTFLLFGSLLVFVIFSYKRIFLKRVQNLDGTEHDPEYDPSLTEEHHASQIQEN